jgi:hypothetical protein
MSKPALEDVTKHLSSPLAKAFEAVWNYNRESYDLTLFDYAIKQIDLELTIQHSWYRKLFYCLTVQPFQIKLKINFTMNAQNEILSMIEQANTHKPVDRIEMLESIKQEIRKLRKYERMRLGTKK